jgi:hypothetical protein
MKFTKDEKRLILKAVQQLAAKAYDAALDAELGGLFIYAEQVTQERMDLEKIARRVYADLQEDAQK